MGRRIMLCAAFLAMVGYLVFGIMTWGLNNVPEQQHQLATGQPADFSQFASSTENLQLPFDTAKTSFEWPAWARKARIAGAYFDPSESAADIESRLDALADQHVTVVIADSPLGQDFSAWVDDDAFSTIKGQVAMLVQKAHERGLKVVLYEVGLERVSVPERNPSTERADWPQRSLDGEPLVFNDIASEQEHWLKKGQWDLWISPCSSFMDFALARTRELVATGIDGLWVDQVYLPTDVGDHSNLWPSSDPCSVQAFQTATGLTMPVVEDWDSPTWRRWVVWRHTQMADFLLALKDAARTVNPDLVFIEENASADTSWSTQNANDPSIYRNYPDLTTAHEVGTIGDRVDEGETGMQNASLDQWLAFRTMMAFARGVDREKPSWILTYGYQPRDSTQLAGMVLAEGGNFYETRGPGMDDTVGAAARKQLFGWIAEAAAGVYEGTSAAEVGLVYSPRTRDLLDSGSGSPYDVEDSIHFAAYRAAAALLYQRHIPFDVVLDTDITSFSRYHVLILPEIQAMSDVTATAIQAFSGKIITIGDTGVSDEWLNTRTEDVLAGVQQHHLPKVSTDLMPIVDTGQLSTDAPASVQIGLHCTRDSYELVLVNTTAASTVPFTINLRLAEGETITGAHVTTPYSSAKNVAVALPSESRLARVTVEDAIDTVSILTLTRSTPSSAGMQVPNVVHARPCEYAPVDQDSSKNTTHLPTIVKGETHP